MRLAVLIKAPGNTRGVSIRLVRIGDNDYPRQLLNSPSPPKSLYIRGLPIPGSRIISIAGSRKASKQALAIAREVGTTLARMGYTIVTGLAPGVDEEATRGVMMAGGHVIGVLPWLDYYRAYILRDYPRATLVSEFPSQPNGVNPRGLFVVRDRVIAWLGEALVVIEARPDSGTIHTFNFARLGGRRVFVLRPVVVERGVYMAFRYMTENGATPFSDPGELVGLLASMGLSRQS